MVPVIRSCQSPIWVWLVNYLHLHLHLHVNNFRAISGSDFGNCGGPRPQAEGVSHLGTLTPHRQVHVFIGPPPVLSEVITCNCVRNPGAHTDSKPWPSGERVFCLVLRPLANHWTCERNCMCEIDCTRVHRHVRILRHACGPRSNTIPGSMVKGAEEYLGSQAVEYATFRDA